MFDVKREGGKMRLGVDVRIGQTDLWGFMV
jgi:hypothetical protein